MRRRDFVAGAVGTVAWPALSYAQAPDRVRRVGVLMNNTPAEAVAGNNLVVFRESLAKLGWIDGRNLQFDVRWAGADNGGYESGAAEIIALAPDVLLVSTSPGTAVVRKRTQAIPIVFVVVTDPVGQGFVPNLAHPGGNVTGFSNYDAPMAGKWLGLLKEVAPGVSRVGLHVNPNTAPYAALLERSLVEAGQAVGVSVRSAFAWDSDGIDSAFANLAATPDGGMVVGPDSFTVAHRQLIIATAAKYRVPTVYPYRVFISDGGLISYGIVTADLFARAAEYVDRILKGAKPADLPVQAPAQFEMAVNLGTAKALGLTVPQSLLHLADEVIE